MLFKHVYTEMLQQLLVGVISQHSISTQYSLHYIKVK